MMKENTLKVFEYIKAHNGEDITSGDVAEALGVTKRSVDGSFTSFQKKGWGIREDAEIELADGSHQKVKFLRFTEAGMTVDPTAPQE